MVISVSTEDSAADSLAMSETAVGMLREAGERAVVDRNGEHRSPLPRGNSPDHRPGETPAPATAGPPSPPQQRRPVSAAAHQSRQLKKFRSANTLHSGSNRPHNDRARLSSPLPGLPPHPPPRPPPRASTLAHRYHPHLRIPAALTLTGRPGVPERLFVVLRGRDIPHRPVHRHAPGVNSPATCTAAPGSRRGAGRRRASTPSSRGLACGAAPPTAPPHRASTSESAIGRAAFARSALASPAGQDVAGWAAHERLVPLRHLSQRVGAARTRFVGRSHARSRAMASNTNAGLRKVVPVLPLNTEIDSVLVPVCRALAGIASV